MKMCKSIVALLCLFVMMNTSANTLPGGVQSSNKPKPIYAYVEKTLDHRNCYNACSLNPDAATREMCFDSCRKANANKIIKSKKPNGT
jgi:hypothetical protein